MIITSQALSTLSVVNELIVIYYNLYRFNDGDIDTEEGSITSPG